MRKKCPENLNKIRGIFRTGIRSFKIFLLITQNAIHENYYAEHTVFLTEFSFFFFIFSWKLAVMNNVFFCFFLSFFFALLMVTCQMGVYVSVYASSCT